MQPIAFLTVRTLMRTPARTALVVLGLGITGALLLDMTMLAGGLRASLGGVLSRLGFAVRVVPRGTLPFSGDAQIADADGLAAAIATRPGVAGAVPVIGTDVYVGRGDRRIPTFALGVPAGGSGVYTVLEGTDLSAGRADTGGTDGGVPVIINEHMARLDGIGIGDRLIVSRSPGRTLEAFAAVETCRVVGVADFYFDLPTQRSLALPSPVLRRLQGRSGTGASLILVRMTEPARAESLARWITARDPRVDAFSIQQFLDRAAARLTYFNQFSLILGTISIAVAGLLITSIVTLSVGERLGEIAMLRALGFTRGRIVELVVAEGVALSVVSLPGALSLGVAIGDYLDQILRAAPAVPEGLHFFTLTAQAVARTAALLIATGAIAGAYPAAVAGRLGIAATLRREIVS